MKNLLIISGSNEDLVSSINDSGNSLFINGDEIPSSDWVGEGDYTIMVRGHPITIKKAGDLEGNIAIVKISLFNYELRKIKNNGSGSIPGGVTSFLDLRDKPKIEGVTLEGDKTYEDLNLKNISNSELENILKI